jgi:hypothetical protein
MTRAEPRLRLRRFVLGDDGGPAADELLESGRARW